MSRRFCDLEGRTALVTGASQGIGEGIALRLAERGAGVVLAARNRAKLEAVAERIAADGGRAAVLELDLTAGERVGEALGALPEPFGAVDILVNNAGITADNLLVRMKREEWDAVLETNLTGTFVVTKALVKGMMRRRWGRVVSVASVVGLMGNAGQTNYAAAKAGLIGFSKSLARELGSRGVTVNVIAPGYVETAMTENLPEASRRELEGGISAGRLGTPEDIAAAAAYLASEEAGYVTGQVLNVSGGLYL